MRTEGDVANGVEPGAVNPVDPRLPPDAPMPMTAQALHPVTARRRDRLLGFLPRSGQAG